MSDVGCSMVFSPSLHADMQVPLSTRGQSPLHFVNFASINKQIRFGCGGQSSTQRGSEGCSGQDEVGMRMAPIALDPG